MKGFRVNKQKYILDKIKDFGGKRILHVGCRNSPNTVYRWENGTLLHEKICNVSKGVNAHVMGIDIDDNSIQFLREKLPQSKF